MHAWTDGQGHEAWLEARTELKDGKFVYAIVSERGSDTIRGRVLHAVLDREHDLINQGDTDKADLTPDNYEFGERRPRSGWLAVCSAQASAEGRAPRRWPHGTDT